MKRAAFLAATVAALLLAAPAGAKTYQVKGTQKVVDDEAGTYKMTGDLLGPWATTSFEEVATSPYYEGKGTEEFKGCIDRRRDRSCAGDPSGTLSFEFRYWALFARRRATVDERIERPQDAEFDSHRPTLLGRAVGCAGQSMGVESSARSACAAEGCSCQPAVPVSRSRSATTRASRAAT